METGRIVCQAFEVVDGDARLVDLKELKTPALRCLCSKRFGSSVSNASVVGRMTILGCLPEWATEQNRLPRGAGGFAPVAANEIELGRRF